MYKKFIGFAAIVIAVATAAFTTPTTSSSRLDDYYFAFDYANYAPTEANVEDESKWKLVSNANSCNLSDQKACVIGVPASMTNAGTPRTLKSTAALDGDEYGSTNIYFISNAASGVSRYNTAQP